MITCEESFNMAPEYPIGRLGNPDDVLFFDIETTGLSADKNQVYMIGVLSARGDEWHLTQWLSDTADSETDVLKAFFSYMNNFKVLVSFNGEAFDMPFLLRRAHAYDLDFNFDGVASVDIYKLARPYKNILGLESCRQKSIESFLGIDREDIYSGGELINVYIQYLYYRDPTLSSLLLLHNADDLKGMPKILTVLSYRDFFNSPLYLGMAEPVKNNGEDALCLTLHCESDISVPVPVRIDADPVSCIITGNTADITIGLVQGTFKHYFPDPEDYYYLIYEDMAVHKSVGQYVSRQARRQATAKTCYVKCDGVFLPQFGEIWEPVMKAGRNDKMCYALIDNVNFSDPDKWDAFSHRLLAWLRGV